MLLFVVDLTARAFTSVFSAVVVGVAVDFFWCTSFDFLGFDFLLFDGDRDCDLLELRLARLDFVWVSLGKKFGFGKKAIVLMLGMSALLPATTIMYKLRNKVNA